MVECQVRKSNRRFSASIFVAVAVIMLRPAPGLGAAPAAPPSARDSIPSRIDGVYAIEGDTARVQVRILFGAFYHLVSSDVWEGVGFLDGAIYRGVFRRRGTPDTPDGATGEHTIDWSDPEHPNVRGTYTSRQAGKFVQSWRRLSDSERRPAVKRPYIGVVPPESGSKFGEYVYVEELPEAVSKVEPVYPDIARHAGVDGTVMVQAYVREDGGVGDTRIVKSIPMLDAAAIECVRQWRFKPAKSKGVPVAVWVAVPVRFPPH